MELTYANHTVRIVQNPTDFIIRFTEPVTHRTYETTFTERSFAEYKNIGGLICITNLLLAGLSTEPTATVTNFNATPTEISFKLTYTPDAHFKMTVPFEIPAVRKDQANADLEALARKVDALIKLTESLKTTIVENEAAFEEKTAKLQKELDSLNSLKVIDLADMDLDFPLIR